MSRETKWILGIIGLLALLYFSLTTLGKHFDRINILERNNEILKENVEYYKEKIKGFEHQQDSIKEILAQNKKEIDSLKGTRELIIIRKNQAKQEVWTIPNSEMQRKFDEKIKQLQGE